MLRVSLDKYVSILFFKLSFIFLPIPFAALRHKHLPPTQEFCYHISENPHGTPHLEVNRYSISLLTKSFFVLTTLFQQKHMVAIDHVNSSVQRHSPALQEAANPCRALPLVCLSIYCGIHVHLSYPSTKSTVVQESNEGYLPRAAYNSMQYAE